MKDTVKRVAVIGAGNGGITAAADLKQKGFEISLYEDKMFPENIATIREKGGILLQDESGESFQPIEVVTNNIERAIIDADIIMTTVPAFAIESIAESLIPVVTEKQIVLINGAGSMGAVRFKKHAEKLGIETAFTIAETNSLTYGTRAFANEARVELSLRVKKIFLSVYPKEQTEEVFEKCKQLYECFVPAQNILHSTLENGNPEVHPGPSLLNAGRIDYSNGEFYLYKEGITKHTVRLLKAIEAERLAIGKAYGFDLEDAVESRYRRGYFSSDQEDLQTLFNNSEVFGNIKGPVSVDSRYFTEDISNGLVLWSDLGKVAGVGTPNIDSVITLGSSILERDFREEGLTLEKLGLDYSSVDEILNAL